MARTDANPPMPDFATDYELQEVDPSFLTASVKPSRLSAARASLGCALCGPGGVAEGFGAFGAVGEGLGGGDGGSGARVVGVALDGLVCIGCGGIVNAPRRKTALISNQCPLRRHLR